MKDSGAGKIRDRMVGRLKSFLVSRTWPRVHMSVIVVLTGASGFLCSAILLKLGIDSMAVRYPVAVALAYLVFFLLLRAWIAWARSGATVPDLTPSELPGIPDLSPGSDAAGQGAEMFQGGELGGGGAGRAFDLEQGAPGAADAADVVDALDALDAGDAPATAGDGLSIDLDLDEGWVLILPLAAAAAVVVAIAGFFVVLAPALFAEVLLDVLLAGGLYRRLKRIDQRHWLESALRRTWAPFAVAAVVALGTGLMLGWAVPEARSVGDVLARLASEG